MNQHSLNRAALVWATTLLAASGQLDAQDRLQTADGDAMLGARSKVYKTAGSTTLSLFIFTPEGHKPSDQRPAIVFFYGGGWTSGTIRQFVPQSKYLAKRGMVAIVADYRVFSRHQARIVDCVSDAQAAVRWVRTHAKELGVDPERIAAGGGSAGGHLAAATATLKDFTGTTDEKPMSARPDALVLFNPALDLTIDDADRRARGKEWSRILERMGAPALDLSPMDHVREGLPPTIIFHGKIDSTVPYAQVEAFGKAMRDAKNRCEVFGFAGEGHGFFNYGRANNRAYEATVLQMDEFLTSLGWLDGRPESNGRGTRKQASDSRYIDAVRTFADNVLTHGRDVYGPVHSPLLVDGLNVDTLEPAIWKLPAREAEDWQMPRESVLSNFGSQQHFLKVLVGLSAVTADPVYEHEAKKITRYALDHLQHESGMLFWGGHAALDLTTQQPIGEGRTRKLAGKHELKCNLPFYELMWGVDRDKTGKFLEACWSNHILRWDILDFNRHGSYEPVPAGLWDQEYVGGPVPFTGDGLTFLNTACDLIQAAVELHQLTGDPRPLTWARRLGQRYADVRHPQTGLGADNYSVLTVHRIQKQFEPEYGDRITEASFASLYGLRYGRAAVIQLKLAERLGDAGEPFKRWAIGDLIAFARHGYDAETNAFLPMINDGTRLSPADRKREGYISTTWLSPRPADGLNFWAYALGYRMSQDDLLWQTARSIGKGIGLGDIGTDPTSPALDANTTAVNCDALFGLLELHKATGHRAYLEAARRVGDNLLAREFHNGWFTADADHPFCKIDTITPLALLHLDAALRGSGVKLPEYAASKSYFHCPFDGIGRTYDNQAIYARVRAETQPAN